VVLENNFLDKAHAIKASSALLLASASIDLIVSDWTVEYVENPSFVVAELTRVPKPGGWIGARTPNRSGYIGIGANLVPNKFHAKILKWLQPGPYRNEKDV
jgi:hypothetical protein